MYKPTITSILLKPFSAAASSGAKTLSGGLSRSKGFTLIELIIVIVLVAILAVTAGPRFFSDRGVEEATLEPRILSMLRLQQQRAMQDTLNPCFGVTLTATQITPRDCTAAVTQDRVLLLPEPALLTVVSGLPAASSGFLFNSLGCPVSNAHETNPEACGQSSVELQVVGVDNRRICIQSQGYIRSGSCN
ncbi:prepilin-type N-terminal cleavage/methylation domain-containing protein [Idiomarina sp. A28L]|uniref:type II secretion system protein n=1 Tax=Idiomarina sp. A28L TaxID=1036674 RepID=UPI0002138841|nr:type II secretion system protein [Idiomarina sp. A28L]EGN74894.1 prepilin-type N-terminal cleavage/methylation domain-containing protein [Idiomarina sp. A28L]